MLKVFMTTKNERNSYNFNINDGKNQFNLATDDAKISAVQNNSLAIAELNTLIENVIKSLPQNISDEQRNEVSENLAFIKTEIQSPNPRKTIIKNTLSVLKAIASTTAFLAALAKLVEFLQL
jgi:predicted transcriptional regulator